MKTTYQKCEDFIKHISDKINIKIEYIDKPLEDFEDGCYVDTTDTIQVRLPSMYPTKYVFYHTIFHEIGHCTGSPKRMNRESFNKSFKSLSQQFDIKENELNQIREYVNNESNNFSPEIKELFNKFEEINELTDEFIVEEMIAERVGYSLCKHFEIVNDNLKRLTKYYSKDMYMEEILKWKRDGKYNDIKKLIDLESKRAFVYLIKA